MSFLLFQGSVAVYLLAAAAYLVFFLNQMIGSNYLFIAHKPETASLIDVLGPWPWYILVLEVIGIVMCLLLYLPYAIADMRKKQITQAAQEAG